MMAPVDMLRRLVEMESPTGDAARMSHIRSFLAAELTALGGTRQPRGEHLLASFGRASGAGETIVLRCPHGHRLAGGDAAADAVLGVGATSPTGRGRWT